ncbi:MAG: hypothetical protein WC141_06810 [Arcobacteraceae bacterium]|jgi:hypothetical protein
MIFSFNNKTTVFLLSFLTLYPWYISIFGIDLTDPGYWLVHYKTFFAYPELAQRGFTTWLSLFFGAATHSLLGHLGLLGFKIANIMVLYAIIFISFLLFKRYASTNFILFSLAVALLLATLDKALQINYNTLTALFYIASAYLLHRALVNKEFHFAFLAGFVLGLNLFIRLPNLVGIGLLSIIFFYFIATDTFMRSALKMFFIAVAGYLTSLILIMTILNLLGHYDLYIESVTNLLLLSTDETFHHSSSTLIGALIENHWKAFRYGILLFGFILFSTWLSKFIVTNNRLLNILLGACFLLFFTALLLFLCNVHSGYDYFMLHHGIIGLTYIALALTVFKTFKTNRALSTLAMLSLMLMVLIPLGSNTSFKHTPNSFFLALPILFIFLFSLNKIEIKQFVLERKELQLLFSFSSLTLILFALIVSHVFYASSGDASAKWKMHHLVAHEQLAYNFTTKERASVLNELLQTLPKYEKDYTYILTYNRIPLISYVSNKLPYIDNPNPLFDMPKTFENKLHAASRHRSLPLIVKGTLAMSKEWPNSGSVKVSNDHYLVLKKFLDANHYEVVWANHAFEILLPIGN